MQENGTEIYNLEHDRRNIQIKDDKQLEDLNKSVQLMSDKFDVYEEDCKEKEKIIDSLQCEVSCWKEKTNVIEKNLTRVNNIFAESV